MAFDTASLTAFERARIAYELMRRHKVAAAAERRIRERARVVRLLAIVASVMVVVIGSAIYGGWLPTAFDHADSETMGEEGRFEETRTGHVRSHYRGDTCRELQFSNSAGRYVGGVLVPCETVMKPQTVPRHSPLEAIRGAFTVRR